MRSLLLLSLAALLYHVSANSLQRQLLRVRRQLLPDKVDIVPGEEEGWSGWSQASECSRTCGIGVQFRERHCLATRSNGEPACTGPNRVYTTCNTEECPEGSHNFREEQCARYNDVEFNAKKYEWLPYFGNNRCELNCYARGEKFYRRHAASVVDGTPCDRDSLDVCVDGVCQHVGCDGVLGSDVEFDKCHICGGDDSQCKTVKGYVQTHHLNMGYHDLVLIPTGSTSINFHEVESSMANLFALRNLNGDYLLNGNFMLHPEGKLNLAGTTFSYSHQPQSLQAEGPTDQPLYVVLIRQHGESHKIQYEYSLPLEYKSGSKEGYDWLGDEWSDCTKECAGGTQTRNTSCVRNSDGEVVDDDLCNPITVIHATRECNTHSCPASWHHGDWEKCSTTCGGGVQVRTVFCQKLASNGFYTIVDLSNCDGQPQPDNIQACNQDISCPVWEVGSWSRCNRICGQGYQTRRVLCQAQHVIANTVSDILPEQRCDSGVRPPSQQECNAGPCRGVEWVVSSWSQCTGTCDEGYETRQVVCSTKTGKVQPEGMCDPAKKPEARRPCSMDEEMCVPKPAWHASQWSECSSLCGPGQQHRRVYCAIAEGESLVIVDNSECDPEHVIPAERKCNGTDCRGRWFMGPWGKCSAKCGGGVMKRDVMCFAPYLVIDQTQCAPPLQPPATEACNTELCKGDAANELPGDQIPVGLCIETIFGCCLDGVTPAQGPFKYGCPEYTCTETLYGCCADGETPAGGPNQEECPSPFDCNNTAFGCCDDGITPANGFNLEGCDFIPVNTKACAQSKYGCCSDGITSAKGLYEEGCEEGSGDLAPCDNSPYGCCADGVTTASGPRGAGCNEILSDCEGSLYGCCPDGYTAADGPNFHGCPGVVIHPGVLGCARTLYGCCPDGTVAALGPNGEGCDHIEIEDCNLTIFGCCPDGAHLAEGPNFEGCADLDRKCENSVHGCCPDGFTSARSSSMEGCPNVVVSAPCQQTSHGCCPDGITPARGYGLQGCQNISQETQDCTHTTYGCCLDGITVSAGANFEGCGEEGTFIFTCDYSAYGCCPDEETPAAGPNQAGCPHRVLTGGVIQIDLEGWLQARCMSVAACGLPEDRGPCSNYSVKWYFDPVYGDCSRFWYGGCDGNDNRFNTKEECQGRCVKPTGELDKCYLPKAPGRCAASSKKYYYNPETQQCEDFVYGGCLGNDNRFETFEECEKQCAVPQKSDVCQQPYLPGPCRGNFEKWFYDQENAMCRQFVYGGCKGNDNRFDSQQACEQRCSEPAEKVCKLPQDSGPCEAAIQNWYFDSNERKCLEFMYGGCKGNGNRYSSQEECERTCEEFLVTKEVDVCTQPQDLGPCKAYFERWFYDQEDGYCKQFVYGGCEGNGNRFETEQDCRSTCNAKPPIDVCTLPSESGLCGESMARFHMDKVSGQCKQFIYSGCDGNGNNFETVEECEKTCKAHIRPAVEGKAHCSQAADGGPCLASMLRYYYDSVESKCKKFLYGGCEGNRNRFISEEACLRACHDDDGDTPTYSPTSPKPTDTPAGPIADLCRIPHNPGPCFDYQINWYYQPHNSACSRFYYGGCGGNSNRFLSEQDCLRRCGPHDVCSQPQDQGSCLGYIPAWSYDAEHDNCVQFVYGGCDGNENRFENQEDCERKCSTVKEAVNGLGICAMKSEAGPCRETETRWFYSSEDGRCRRFLYGGCEGNQNNFVTEEECQNACPLEGVCSLPSETGPCRAAKSRYYHNSASNKCEEFIYGGCAGNANRFMTMDTCRRTCEPETETASPTVAVVSSSSTAPSTPGSAAKGGDSSVCNMQKDPGACTDYYAVWYFEPNTRTCRRFLFGGCGGNGNRFETRAECDSTCLNVKKSTPPSSTPTSTTLTKSSTLASEQSLPSLKPSQDEDICMLKQDEGRYCTGWNLYWYFDAKSASCRRFYWGGCDGNRNRFQTEEHCKGHCMSVKKQATEDVCAQPMEKGPCSDIVPRWYHDVTSGLCEQFYFGGCKGNENNFRTEDECMNRCITEENSGSVGNMLHPDTCLQPHSRGPCEASLLRWYYDLADQSCKDFVYGGCGGNGNNFASQQKCEVQCKLTFIQEADICELPKDQGPCFALQLRWYFDMDEGRCAQFQYGGCQGNPNNFKLQKECEESCGSKVEKSKADKKHKDSCKLPKEAGPCFVDYLRFYYDEQFEECRPFVYGGCQGNTNNFETQEECYSSCSPDTKNYKIYKPGDCYEAPDPGPCIEAEPKWHFDASIGDCLAFYYGGCEGNGNNFRTYDECLAMCSKVQETCGVFQCDLECPVGFSRGPDGCLQCRCLNPCDAKNCPADTECQIHEINCVTTPCPGPEAVCVPTTPTSAGECPVFDANDPALCVTECDEDEDCGGSAKCCATGCGKICLHPELPVTNAKPGFCPPLQPGLSSTCDQLCGTDMDCPQSGKCCSTGCGMICMPALYLSSGCVNTVYGCCPDNKTPAKGWNHQGCTEEAPVIEESSSDLVAQVGERVIIPCKASGVPPPTISWFRNRKPILVSSLVDEEEGLAMLDDGSLEIVDVLPEDSTTYSCRAFNPIGSATASYTLLVQVPVSLQDTPLEVEVGVGGEAVLECSASGTPVPAIRWMQNGQVLPMDDHYTQNYQGSLVIQDVTLLDEGQYTCEAENGVGDPMLRTVSLQVQTAFSVSISAFNESYKVGEELNLHCEVEGATDLKIMWTKDEETLSVDARVVATDDGELYIGDVQSSDAGVYTCSATRDGDTATASAKLEVIGVKLPEDCVDKPWYADCALIIEAKMCRHPYFSVFCCQSCHEAGLLP